MPKKHQKPLYAKPASTAHHTLTSSPHRDQNERFRSSQGASSSAESPSVNDLIDHLRRTQVFRSSENDQRPIPRHVAPRSVHPSLRNLLELPETPPPRPRPGNRRTAVGGQRVRRIPGPPPPASWLAGNHGIDNPQQDELDLFEAGPPLRRVIHRLERLPGAVFPRENTLLHTLLRSMAFQWSWHLEYDGQFLSILPTHLRVLLLSYVAVYAPLPDHPSAHIEGHPQPAEAYGQMAQGIKLLLRDQDSEDDFTSTDSNVTRLDFGGAIGRYMSLRQLSNELFAYTKPTQQSKAVPSSWEDEDDEDDEDPGSGAFELPQTPTQRSLRFENLRYLSLAHPKAANWTSLIALLSHLPTLTHLSLAHWPTPTATPNAVNATIRHPTQRSLTFSYSGTDAYAAHDNNWAEAASLLRKLSRVTYCLKWLDLEGCAAWLPAINWDDPGPDGRAYATGPEWNGSWRDIEYIRLGPGWLPDLDHGETGSSSTKRASNAATASSSLASSLAASVHAPAANLSEDGLPWDVEEERLIRRREKELAVFRDAVHIAKAVQQQVRGARTSGRGKWVQFSFGLENLDENTLRRLLGSDFLRLLP